MRHLIGAGAACAAAFGIAAGASAATVNFTGELIDSPYGSSDFFSDGTGAGTPVTGSLTYRGGLEPEYAAGNTAEFDDIDATLVIEIAGYTFTSELGANLDLVTQPGEGYTRFDASSGVATSDLYEDVISLELSFFLPGETAIGDDTRLPEPYTELTEGGDLLLGDDLAVGFGLITVAPADFGGAEEPDDEGLRSVVFRIDEATIIPTPAAAALGLAVLAGAALRRRSNA